MKDYEMTMSNSDSMFLFEIIVEDIVCYEKCKRFYIRSDFSDIFSIYLGNPKYSKEAQTKPRKKKLKKMISSNFCQNIKSDRIDSKLQSGETMLFSSNINTLREKMKTFPMEVTILMKRANKLDTGSVQIPWSNIFYEFLDTISSNNKTQTLTENCQYSLYHNVISKRVAIVDLKVKLTYFEGKISNLSKYIVDDYTGRDIYPNDIESKSLSYINKLSISQEKEIKNPGIIKTTYRGKTLEQYNQNKNKTNNVHTSNINVCTSISNIDANNIDVRIPKNPKNQVYCIGYCTIENANTPQKNTPSTTTSKGSLKQENSSTTSEKDSEEPVPRYRLRICDSECPSKEENTCSICSLDLPETARPLITVTKCQDVTCDDKVYRKLPTPVDSKILIDLHSRKHPCCDPKSEAAKLVSDMMVTTSIKTEVRVENDPCMCTCECAFGFTQRTEYCNICRGFQKSGDDLARVPGYAMPHPCPLYHKLMDKAKNKTPGSTSGSESKKSIKAKAAAQRESLENKGTDSEKDLKSKKKKRDDRFKFHYGYTAPVIGHSKCALPCHGTISNVPKHMGWLWTSEDVPGMKFRPNWKPGASNKHVVRMLKIARNPGEAINKKKRRKDGSKRRKNDKRPLLIVHKKDGEYNVTMETMKIYQKPRNINQFPYEDKPALTYNIGRTDEENWERQKSKQRKRRRLERAQREFIQGSFKNMCEDICLKTYQQALGILPGTEDPDCPCYPAFPDAEKLGLDRSCSCSEDDRSLESETDSDEWIVEFTPPNAKFDPTFKGKRIVKVDNSSQYTYLDYRVKLLDRFGNPVPRFFKGPDGKEECSDLGGFWSPDKVWLDINIDGYIAPDGRWAPNTFIGPGGETVDAETGKFQAPNGKWLVVGVDGFIDCQGKWRFYKGRAALAKDRPKRAPASKRQGGGDKKDKEVKSQKSHTTWSCFGDISPRYLSEMGIVGHGRDKEMLKKSLKEMLSRGQKLQLPKKTGIPRIKRSKRNQAVGSSSYESRKYFNERQKCFHAVPSDKGITAVDAEGNKTYFRLAKYQNRRPDERLGTLNRHGISTSSFHVPCLSSFISTELMKKQQRERLFDLASKLTSNYSRVFLV